jgi:hypothetical protein
VVASMLGDLPELGPTEQVPGFSVSVATPELIDAWLRMMRLVDRPKEAAVLAPLIEREILYRILQGPQGDKLPRWRTPKAGCRMSAVLSTGSGPTMLSPSASSLSRT